MDLREAIDAITRWLAELFASDAAPAGERDVAFADGDLDEQLATHRSGLLLGLYDEAAVARALERGGVLGAIRARLGADVHVHVVADEGILRAHRADLPEGPDSLVLEVKAHRMSAAPEPLRALGFPAGELLALDWFLMQDPGRPFAPGRRALPGQRHPGLGVGGKVIESIRRAARAFGAVGVLGTPAYYHNAVLYHRLFAFGDPVAEGRFQALVRDLAALPLAEAAFAVDEGRVRDATFDQPFRWAGEPMVLPIADVARAYFADPRYADAAARTLVGTRFFVQE